MPRTHISLVILVGALLPRHANADHVPAIPRNVVELQLGPLHLGALLPEIFQGCKTSPSAADDEEYLSFVDDPSAPGDGVLLRVSVDCVDPRGDVVPCARADRRYVKLISLLAPPRKPLPNSRPERFCRLPVPASQLSTARGIRLGDSIQRVLAAYGPPSVNEKLARRPPRKEFYVTYTKGTETGDDRELQFRFRDRRLYEINIFPAEGM